MELLARTLIFSFGSGVTLAEGRQEAVEHTVEHTVESPSLCLLLHAHFHFANHRQTQNLALVSLKRPLGFYKIIPLLLPITNKHKI